MRTRSAATLSTRNGYCLGEKNVGFRVDRGVMNIVSARTGTGVAGSRHCASWPTERRAHDLHPPRLLQPLRRDLRVDRLIRDGEDLPLTCAVITASSAHRDGLPRGPDFRGEAVIKVFGRPRAGVLRDRLRVPCPVRPPGSSFGLKDFRSWAGTGRIADRPPGRALQGDPPACARYGVKPVVLAVVYGRGEPDRLPPSTSSGRVNTLRRSTSRALVFDPRGRDGLRVDPQLPAYGAGLRARPAELTRRQAERGRGSARCRSSPHF